MKTLKIRDRKASIMHRTTCVQTSFGVVVSAAAVHFYHKHCTAPINSRLNVVVRSPAPFGLGRNGCWPSRGSQLPRALPFILSLCCALNDRRRAAHSIFKTTYQFFYLSLSLRSFVPTSAPLPSTFTKLAGMALPLILTLTVLQQRNTHLFLFPLLLFFLPLSH